MSRPGDKRPTETIRGEQVLKVVADGEAFTITFEMADRRVVLDGAAVDKMQEAVEGATREAPI